MYKKIYTQDKMGIRHLNRFLRDNAQSSIKMMSL